MHSESFTDLVMGLEATSVYGEHITMFLRKDASLAPYNHKVFVLNPKQVNKFKAAYPDLPKNDYVNAFIIAEPCVLEESTRISIQKTIVMLPYAT